jgi:hypothetical protein
MIEDGNEGNFLILQFYEKTEKSKSEIKLKFPFIKDSYFIFHSLKKYFILDWQKRIEKQILANNDQIYNFHFYIKKLNRWGKAQDRLLILTNKVKFKLKIVFSSFYIISFLHSKRIK